MAEPAAVNRVVVRSIRTPGAEVMETTLDLHGISHEDVPDVVHQFINANWKPNLELSIITGYSDRMKTLVYSILKQYDLEVVTTDMRNGGKIKVQTWHE